MRKLLRDLWSLLQNNRKALKRVGITAAVLLVAAVATFVQVSESPRFCISCHIMKPYYDAWKTSKHNKVKCLECHYPPGVKNHIASKFRASSQIVQYFTGSYGTRLWAEIDDKACLREGCHDTRLLTGPVTFKKNIKFDHAFHLGEMPRGKRLRCTSCHSQIVVGTHIEVTESVCFACHFKGAKLGEGTADCLLCHGPPQKPVTYKGITFDHTSYLKRNVPCTQCHMHVVAGDGAVPPTRCYSCHADRSRAVTDPARLHRIHVTDHKVECYECHLEIRHGTQDLSPLLAPDCAGCHGNMHNVSESVYVGTGGLDTASVPSEMFTGGVSCSGCHNAPTHGIPPASTEETGAFPRATGEVCAACHGFGFDDVLAQWQNQTKTAYDKGRALVSRAAATVDGANADDASRARARTLLAEAEKNLELVAGDKSFGAHNVIYTNALIETAASKAAAASKAVGASLPYDEEGFRVLGEKETCAWRCHFGVERKTLAVNGKTFEHGKHVVDAGVKCAACHDAERHGYTLPTTYNCAACHHVKDRTDCASCHGDVSRKAVNYKGFAFDHGAHVGKPGVSCATCHAAGNPVALEVNCAACHHKPDVKTACGACHVAQADVGAGKGAPGGAGAPAPMNKLGCKACHGQRPVKPTGATCAKCHPGGYAAVLTAWQNGTKKNYKDLSIRLKEARDRKGLLAGVAVDGANGLDVYNRAAGDLRWAGDDGSWGAHNNDYVNTILKADLAALDQALKSVGP